MINKVLSRMRLFVRDFIVKCLFLVESVLCVVFVGDLVVWLKFLGKLVWRVCCVLVWVLFWKVVLLVCLGFYVEVKSVGFVERWFLLGW